MQVSAIQPVVFIQSVLLLLLILSCSKQTTRAQTNTNEEPTAAAAKAPQSPQPVQTASYVSLDGLTLVIIFDKPVNLSSYIESVELRRQNEAEEAETSTFTTTGGGAASELLQPRTIHPHFEAQTIDNINMNENNQQCFELTHLAERSQPETQELVHGIQLCARLLTKKTLKLLHKFRLYDCVWPSRVQFLVQLGRPVAQSGPIKISFQRQTISEFNQELSTDQGEREAAVNEREISLDLNRLPLESLGVPLAPRVAITGPNQVPSCGQFVLSAHLSSPFGTQPEESVKLNWSVERTGFIHPGSSSSAAAAISNQQPPMMLFNGSQLSPAARANQINADSQGSEARWKQLQQIVSSQKANNLVIDSQLLQFSPQIYEFRLSVSFSTSLTSVNLNTTHQVSRLDFETPMGAIYGSHILAQQPQLNTNQDLLLLADIQVPDCAQNIKQVGLYWQVSDSRVRFEQTYAPYYLAKPNTLPEQSQLEFRLNLFYGIRVKKYSSNSAIITTGDSVLDAQISGGALVLNIGQDSPSNQLELFGGGTIPSDQQQLMDKYTYQWSCFDGKTAQPCFRNSGKTSNNITDAGGTSIQPPGGPLDPGTTNTNSELGGRNGPSLAAASGLPLIDRQQQRQTNLKLPLEWLDHEAQLWFGLQRFDRSSSTSNSQQSQTEYALVELQPGHSASLSIGPVLVGPARQHRATLRNPLTGAILLLANSPAIIVGRLSPAQEIKSFMWHSPNFMGQLHWISRNSTNPITGQDEIYTELHLSPGQQVAHAHSQIQLIACTHHRTSQQQQQQNQNQQPGPSLLSIRENELMTASLNLDTVQSVSQCQVNANLLSQSSLAISVDHCNIPLGLSPITYQIYMVDTSGLDGFMAENNPTSTTTPSNGAATSSPQNEDYINEADMAFFENQAQPLTMPQLSSVFVLNGFNPLSLAALLGSSDHQRVGNNTITGAAATATSVRFGGRVCDRLQTCRTFYSPPIGLKQLIRDWQLRAARQSAAATAATATGSGSGNSNQSLPLLDLSQQQPQQQQQFGRQQASSLLQSLQSMIDSSKRANMAGNSIGAISILNAAMTLGQRLLIDGDTNSNARDKDNMQESPPPPQLHSSSSKLLMSNFRDRVRDFLQTSMRDCLHYGTVSMQRQFHYTDSGQTNLVLHSLTRILSLPQSNIELKFRALKLISQLIRRTIQEQLSLKTNCLADLKTIERAYESLFATFTHYAIDTSDTEAELASTTTTTATTDTGTNQTNNDASTSSSGSDSSAASSNNNRQQQWTNNYSSTSGGNSGGGGGGRRKRGQEAALAYLKSVRLAYRSLLAATAMQLPLGETHQLRYAAAPNGLISQQMAASSSISQLKSAKSIHQQQQQQQQQRQQKQRHRSDHLISAEQSTSTTTTSDLINGTNVDVNKQQVEEAAVKLPRISAATTLPIVSSDILSSLTHLTGSSDLLMPSPPSSTSSTSSTGSSGNINIKKSIDVNFNQLGFVSITFDQRFLQRLASLLKEGHLLCKNTASDTNGASGKPTITTTTAAATGTTTTTTTTGTITSSTSTSALPPIPIIGSSSSTLSGNGGGGGIVGSQFYGGNNCSSFVLALTSFAGKAPFRSLDEGQSLRVPHIEVSLLSPLDGSDLLGTQQQQDALMANEDIKTEVTFSLANLDGEKPSASGGGQQQESSGSSHSGQARRRYKCYQFDEDANEWVRVAQGERHEVEQQGEKRIRCTFNGFGVFAAFQGKPPPAEAPLKSPVVLGLLALITLIIIISVTLCCCANGNGTKNDGDGSNSGNTSEDGDDKRGIQRHPEQTYRSDFDYPPVGGG